MSRNTETSDPKPDEKKPDKSDDATTTTEDRPFVSKVINPAEIEAAAAEASAAEAAREAPIIPPGNHAIVYRGRAHRVRHEEHTFRPGEPVVVPSEVAEELLTNPREPFELVDGEPKK